MARPSITAPIASATSVQQTNDLVAATHLELDALPSNCSIKPAPYQDQIARTA